MATTITVPSAVELEKRMVNMDVKKVRHLLEELEDTYKNYESPIKSTRMKRPVKHTLHSSIKYALERIDRISSNMLARYHKQHG
jgi:hypothetical protein